MYGSPSFVRRILQAATTYAGDAIPAPLIHTYMRLINFGIFLVT
jgi:hypothetical protein